MRTLPYPFLDPSDLMNRNGKWMKPQATHLTEAPIDVEAFCKVEHSEPNRASEHRSMTQTTKNIDDEVKPIETFVESKGATDFKGFEAPHNIVLHIKRKLDKCMMNHDGRLRHFNKTLTN